eukprot:TRINITY_DN13646_c0_g2_i1.p1 TRINITY_DN13646_c0_g2~~TRINITY_DN13646_c0_g2_i1.p1  ORF type:complete len:759 (+),score=105.15 TRINITY_DN13646_c0_g2_i1:90-2279(+)
MNAMPPFEKRLDYDGRKVPNKKPRFVKPFTLLPSEEQRKLSIIKYQRLGIHNDLQGPYIEMISKVISESNNFEELERVVNLNPWILMPTHVGAAFRTLRKFEGYEDPARIRFLKFLTDLLVVKNARDVEMPEIADMLRTWGDFVLKGRSDDPLLDLRVGQSVRYFQEDEEDQIFFSNFQQLQFFSTQVDQNRQAQDIQISQSSVQLRLEQLQQNEPSRTILDEPQSQQLLTENQQQLKSDQQMQNQLIFGQQTSGSSNQSNQVIKARMIPRARMTMSDVFFVKDILRAKLKTCEPWQLASVAYGCGALGLRDRQVLKGLQKISVELLQNLSIIQMMEIVQAFGRLDMSDDELFVRMTPVVKSRLMDATPYGLAEFSYAYGKLGFVFDDIFGDLSEATIQKITQFQDIRELGRVLKGFASVDIYNEQFVSTILNRAQYLLYIQENENDDLRHQRIISSYLIGIIDSCVSLRHHDRDAFREFLSMIVDNLDKTNIGRGVVLFESLARFGHYEQQLYEKLFLIFDELTDAQRVNRYYELVIRVAYVMAQFENWDERFWSIFQSIPEDDIKSLVNFSNVAKQLFETYLIAEGSSKQHLFDNFTDVLVSGRQEYVSDVDQLSEQHLTLGDLVKTIDSMQLSPEIDALSSDGLFRFDVQIRYEEHLVAVLFFNELHHTRSQPYQLKLEQGNKMKLLRYRGYKVIGVAVHDWPWKQKRAVKRKLFEGWLQEAVQDV